MDAAAAADERVRPTARGTRRGAWRWLAWLGALALVAALVTVAVLVSHPYRREWLVAAVRSIPMRVRLAQASWQPAPSRAGGVVRCAAARTVGQPASLLPLDSVPDDAIASALFVWSTPTAAAAELRALRGLAPAGTLQELSGAGTRAVVLTADGARLRAARRVAPTARPQLAVGGTRALCVVAS